VLAPEVSVVPELAVAPEPALAVTPLVAVDPLVVPELGLPLVAPALTVVPLDPLATATPLSPPPEPPPVLDPATVLIAPELLVPQPVKLNPAAANATERTPRAFCLCIEWPSAGGHVPPCNHERLRATTLGPALPCSPSVAGGKVKSTWIGHMQGRKLVRYRWRVG
jgi:hypothetical protein